MKMDFNDRKGTMQRLLYTAVLFLILNTGLFAQSAANATISGFVYDASNGEALIGANVFLKDTGRGSSTNINGYFVIPRLEQGAYELVVHYIGYESFSERITVGSGQSEEIKIQLQPKAIVVDEVVVFADSVRLSKQLYDRPISKIELNQRQINSIPQIAEADLLRSLQTLPGILPISDFSSALYVRGGTPDQNLYLLDGTDVYNPEHAFGLFSTFNTDAIKQIELSKGGFGAEYGGRLSSILDVTNLDGNRREFEGTSTVSLLSAKTTLQMPLGKNGSLSGSIRRTYFDKTIARAIEDVPDYYFYDGNIKAFFELDPHNNLTVSYYGGRDFLDLIFNPGSQQESGFNYDWGNRTGSVRWTRVFTPQLFGNFWVTTSRFSSDFLFGEDLPVTERNLITDFTLKGNLEYHYSEHFGAKFGFEQKNLHAIFRQTFPGGKVDVDKSPKHYVAFFATSIRPNIRWEIDAGVRYNYFNSERKLQNLAPRFSTKYRLTDTINLKAAAGVYYQYLHKIPRAFIADIWTSANEYQNASKSEHVILGFQKEVANNYQLEIEGYYKTYENIYQFDQNFLTEISADRFENGEPVYTGTRGLFNEGDGNSRGFEVLLRKDSGLLTGWIGYSFAKTEYTFDRINNGEAYSPRHDRTSVVNLIANVDLRNALRVLKGKPRSIDKSKWQLGVNFIYTSGQPITTPGSAYFVNTAPNFNFFDFKLYPSDINAYRLPAYARIDVSLTYEKRYKTWTLAPYLQIYNIGNRKNVWFVQYKQSIEGNKIVQDIKPVHMFPLLPSLGVNFKF